LDNLELPVFEYHVADLARDPGVLRTAGTP
jgi:hypothetical protein